MFESKTAERRDTGGLGEYMFRVGAGIIQIYMYHLGGGGGFGEHANMLGEEGDLLMLLLWGTRDIPPPPPS